MKRTMYIWLPVLVVFLGFLSVITDHSGILIFEGDSYHQMYQFYLGGWQRLRDLSLSSFDYSIGFGGSAIAMLYYLFSPFFFVTILFDKEMIQYLFLYLNEIKIVLLFIFTYIWAKQLSTRKETPFMAAFMIGFGGWTFSYLHLNMFLDAFLLYPLAFFFIDRYLKEGKVVGMCLTMALIGIINYYFLYMLIPYACIYALIRYCMIHDELEVKKTCIEALKFVGYVLLAVGIACIVLIPVAFMISSNPRFDSLHISLLDHIGKNELFKIVSSFFVPVLDHEDTTLFMNITHFGFIGWGGGASLYLSMLAAVVLPLGIFMKDQKKKLIYILTLTLLAVFVFFEKFWILFQMNMESRWFYMISFTFVMIIMDVHEEIMEGKIEKKWVLLGAAIALCGVWGCYGVALLAQLNDMELLKSSLYIIIVLSAFIVAYAAYYLKLNRMWFLVGLLCLESIFSMRALVSHENIIPQVVTEAAASTPAVLETVKNDDSFYRVRWNQAYTYFDDGSYYRYTTSNTPFANNVPGLSFYSTIYNSQQEDFLHRLKNNWQMDERYGSNELYNMLSTKYLVSTDTIKNVPFGYELVEEKDGSSLYENRYWVELGYGYDKTISKDAFAALPYMTQDLVMQDYLVTETSENDKYTVRPELMDNLGPTRDRYYDFWEGPVSNVTLYFDIGTITHTTISLFYKDECVYAQDFYQYNYVDIYVPEDMLIDRIIISSANDDEGDILFWMQDMKDYEEYHEERYRDRMTNVVFAKDEIEADFHASQDEYVFTAVPYDIGWQVEVDGEKVLVEKVQLGYVGFKVSEGDHHISMHYTIPYAKVGIAVTAISLAALFVIVRRKK